MCFVSLCFLNTFISSSVLAPLVLPQHGLCSRGMFLWAVAETTCHNPGHSSPYSLCHAATKPEQVHPCAQVVQDGGGLVAAIQMIHRHAWSQTPPTPKPVSSLSSNDSFCMLKGEGGTAASLYWVCMYDCMNAPWLLVVALCPPTNVTQHCHS